MTGAEGCAASASAARRAAKAASSPCPSPSMAATRTPPSNGHTRCRSPEVDWPRSGREETPQSRAADVSALPLAHRDGGAFARLGVDLELVHQPPGTGEPKSQSTGGRETVLHGQTDIGDPRTVVPHDHGDPALPALLD